MTFDALLLNQVLLVNLPNVILVVLELYVSFNGTKVRVFLRKHDKYYYYFWNNNFLIINLIVVSRNHQGFKKYEFVKK